MGFEGDYGGVSISVPIGDKIQVQMSTSIVRVHTSSGFGFIHTIYF